MGTAIYTGVTGLLAHQRRMDVVANNIANVNTTGFRGSRLIFQDLLSQTLDGGSPPVGNFGGTNPIQVGLGVGIASVDIDQSPGSLLTTGVASDLAIQGNGLFVLTDGTGKFYTRDGTFGLNENGILVDPATGMRVQGYAADSSGLIDTNVPPGDLTIPIGATATLRQTQNAVLAGNLDSNAADGTVVQRTVRVYDSLGAARDIQLAFTKRAQVTDGGTLYNAWLWNATFNGANDVTSVPVGQSGVILFDSNGVFHAEGAIDGTAAFTARASLPSQNQISIPTTLFTGGSVPTTPLEVKLNLSGVTDQAANSDVALTSQDGFARGVLQNFSIGTDGTITGAFTNGLTQRLGQIALASFANVGGLARHGDNTFVETSSSGLAQIGAPSTGGRGTIVGGTLEGSNVDLGTEFSNMIVTQRAYQANARTITAADGMLQEAANLIR